MFTRRVLVAVVFINHLKNKSPCKAVCKSPLEISGHSRFNEEVTIMGKAAPTNWLSIGKLHSNWSLDILK